MCNCGCNTCETKGPLLTEGKVKSLLSEGLQYHIDKKIPLFETVYRIGSKKHLSLIKEARKMYSRNVIDLCEEDEALIKTHLGEFALYEGESVPLDLPMLNESKYDKEETIQQTIDRLKARIEDPNDGMNVSFIVQKIKDLEKSLNEYLNEYSDENFDSLEDAIANSEFGMDYDQLGSGEKEWVRDEIDNMSMNESLNEKEGVPHYTKDGKEWKGKLHKMPDGSLMSGNPHDKNGSGPNGESEKLYHKEDLNEDKKDIYEAIDIKSDIVSLIGNMKSNGLIKSGDIDGNSSKAKGKFKATIYPTVNTSSTLKDFISELKKHYNFEGTTDAGKKVFKFNRKLYGWLVNNEGLSVDIVLMRKLPLKEDRKYNQEELLRLDLIARRRFDCDYEKCTDEQKSEVLKDKVKVGVKEALQEAKKEIDEAEFKGKKVSLGKPKRGGPKAYYVYVKDGDKVKKVTFGSGGLRAKIKNKEARNAFAARHNCKDKKDRTKAGYWSCNLPRYAPALGLGAKMNTFW